MAWSGSGVFARIHNWVTDRDAAIDITASRMDAEMDGMATGITACLAKNGENAATANLPMGGFEHTGVGNSTARDNYGATGQIQDGSFVYAADSGAADAYVMTLSPVITAYATGQKFLMKAANANTTASVINIDSVGSKAIVDAEGNALTGGEIVASAYCELVYDGTAFRLQNPALGSVGAGKQSIWVSASSMVSRTTSGATYGETELATNDVMVASMAFDTSTDEFAQFSFQAPKGWDEGTISFQPVWSHPSTTTNFGVVFFLQGGSYSNGDAGDTAFGTAVSSTDTGGTTNDFYIGPESAAITIAGSPAEGDYLVFQVYRDVSDGSDNLAVDARLHGIMFFITTDANTDD